MTRLGKTLQQHRLLHKSAARHWAAWLLVLAVFLQAFVPALVQAASSEHSAPWGEICSTAAPTGASVLDLQSAPASDHLQNPHCAYCLLGGAVAPPPLGGFLPLPVPQAALQQQPLPYACPSLRLVWAAPPLRGPPATFA